MYNDVSLTPQKPLHKYGVFTHTTSNVGDEVQSIAAAHFLPRLDMFEKTIIFMPLPLFTKKLILIDMMEMYNIITPRFGDRCNSFDSMSGYIIHHYNGIWGTCAPGRRNMHHQGAICTMMHKGDYIF